MLYQPCQTLAYAVYQPCQKPKTQVKELGTSTTETIHSLNKICCQLAIELSMNSEFCGFKKKYLME